jgi:hypothetical protein
MIIQYPCTVVNRFECLYEKDKKVSKNKDTDFDINDLFELEKMAFAVEVAFAKTEDHTSKVHLKNKQELYHALTDRETFSSILEQSYDNNKEEEAEYLKYNKDKIVDYFMNIRDKVKLEELDLNFYPCRCNSFVFSSV